MLIVCRHFRCVHPSETNAVQCVYQCSRIKYKINTDKFVGDMNIGRAANNSKGRIVIKITMPHLVKKW